ncbi:MAG TPA: hypothetical protein VGG75_18425 [Trebonia sp.]|jgi:hypothetical protein
MASIKTAGPAFGTGPLARASALVYTLLVTEGLLLLTSAPGLVPLLLLGGSASNLPLDAACLIPAGPAASAALFALWRRSGDLADLRPAAAFWRGYRLNLAGVLRLYVPWLAVMTMVAMGLAHGGAAGVPGWWRVLLAVIAAAGTLWLANAMVITSLFAFRVVDVARLAAYFLGQTPLVALGNAGVLIAGALVTAFGTEPVAMLFAAVGCLALLMSSRPMTGQVKDRFTA